ncbi:MAG: DUF4142 domain-containing protein [Pseudonocardia sp.]|nr:DUF4142 domain-containing protein [Pseudonocardia sp.]
MSQNAPSRPVHRAAAACIAVVATVGLSACGAPADAPTAPPVAEAPAAAAGAAAGAAADKGLTAALGAAGAGAAGLAALGELGKTQGAGSQVKELGGKLATEGQALLDQLQGAAKAAGVNLDTATPAELAATLADLKARQGAAFDPAWLKAASEQLQKVRDAANAVLTSPDASAEAKAAAQAALTKLDGLAATLAKASSAAGANAPSSVPAGNGGQAAQSDWAPVGIGIAGFGVVLLAAAAFRRRAHG